MLWRLAGGISQITASASPFFLPKTGSSAEPGRIDLFFSKPISRRFVVEDFLVLRVQFHAPRRDLSGYGIPSPAGRSPFNHLLVQIGPFKSPDFTPAKETPEQAPCSKRCAPFLRLTYCSIVPWYSLEFLFSSEDPASFQETSL